MSNRGIKSVSGDEGGYVICLCPLLSHYTSIVALLSTIDDPQPTKECLICHREYSDIIKRRDGGDTS